MIYSHKVKSNLQTPLYNFMIGRLQNPEGITIKDILDMDEQELEDNHKYIQWCFPLETKSKYNSSAPVLDDMEIYLLIHSQEARKNFYSIFEKMLVFYGFSINYKRKIQIKDVQKVKEWSSNRPHNFLRITRIINSLTLLGYKNLAQDFQTILLNSFANIDELKDILSEETKTIWENIF